MNAFQDKVVYQIYTKSFRDTNGDGIGDLKGVTEKLDYLQGLGVDYLWLNPFFLSPQRDNGYDIADYTRIEPMFGTMEDFEELVVQADKRDLGLMMDMVFNHTSTQHEWFQKALASDPYYQAYYFFRDGTEDSCPTNWESKFGGSAWEYVPHLKKWYLHLFDVTQADLNWENPNVREELKNVIRFWKQKGVKGFRFDVVNLISKPEVFEDDLQGDGRRFYTDGRRVHQHLKELVQDTGIADMITVGEMSSTTIDHCVRYSNPDERELTMCFNFHHLKVDYKNGDKWARKAPDYMELKKLFEDWQERMQEGNGWNALFWCNHDQPRIVSRLGDDQRYWKQSAKMLATCIHLLRGTPYIYQGEEVGMTNAYYTDVSQYRDVESRNYYEILLQRGKTKEQALELLGCRSRDNGRTPMQWDASTYAGFSETEPWISVPEYKREANVQAELNETDSVLHYYKQLIQLRKTMPVIAEGTVEFLYRENPDVFAYRRTLGDTQLVVLNNFTDHPVELSAFPFADRKKIFGNYTETNEETNCLRPFESVVLA